MTDNIQSSGGESNYEKMDIYYPEKKEETPININTKKSLLKIYIIIAISLIIIGLIIFLIVFFATKNNNKNGESEEGEGGGSNDDKDNDNICIEGYFIPEGQEKIKENCQKCSLDNCKICKGTNTSNYCFSCLSNYHLLK